MMKQISFHTRLMLVAVVLVLAGAGYVMGAIPSGTSSAEFNERLRIKKEQEAVATATAARDAVTQKAAQLLLKAAAIAAAQRTAAAQQESMQNQFAVVDDLNFAIVENCKLALPVAIKGIDSRNIVDNIKSLTLFGQLVDSKYAAAYENALRAVEAHKDHTNDNVKFVAQGLFVQLVDLLLNEKNSTEFTMQQKAITGAFTSEEASQKILVRNGWFNKLYGTKISELQAFIEAQKAAPSLAPLTSSLTQLKEKLGTLATELGKVGKPAARGA